MRKKVKTSPLALYISPSLISCSVPPLDHCSDGLPHEIGSCHERAFEKGFLHLAFFEVPAQISDGGSVHKRFVFGPGAKSGEESPFEF